ncbi:MAG: ABC transporter ATP-binding protein [Myxococcales bacterium]|nr:ABC transporter ATP-binding protein [Myxococcales bacterium]
MVADTDEVVRVEGVVKDFRPGFGLRRKRVLHGVTFSVHDGEIFGFVGPNGAGKTTTLKILMGLIRPTAGRASILGCDVRESEFRHQIGFLPENPYFYPYLTAREILDFYARLSGMPSALRRRRIPELLERVNLVHAADARLKTYSKGMLQRVGVAQALVHDPRVVFLDEPMSGLDPIGRKEIRDVILDLRAAGKTVLMNTHILHDVEMICDRVAIIVGGRIRHQGPVDAFLPEADVTTDVVLSQLPADAATRLEERFGLEMRGLGDRVELRIDDKHVGDLLGLALGAGARVVSVTPHRRSLEDLFLSTVRAPEVGPASGGGEEAA